MKLDKVYIGVTKKDGKERVLYQTYYCFHTDLNSIYCQAFIDLDTKEAFNSCYIDSDNLIPFESILDTSKKRMRRRKVIHTYKVDRLELIPTEKLVYGDLIKREESSICEQNLYGKGYNKQIVKKHALFVDKDNNQYQSVKTGEIYSSVPKCDSKEYYVDNIRNLERDFRYLDSIPKRKVLELDYKKRLY